mmetsp:Transcript_34688/g.61001  ORF Transcript_34688/g.61001 Transcript_34688/m.61001 type:complete len:318 (+) Transcript_34688:2236-3189(+)
MLAHRGSSSPSNDVIFEASENLHFHSTLCLAKGCTKRIPISRPRTLESYCFEFCGIVGISFEELSFFIDSRPANLDMHVSFPIIVGVHLRTDLPKNLQSSLEPALLELFNSGVNSDVQIVTRDGKTFNVHKCILMCRSQKFMAMFSSSMKERDSPVELTETDSFLFEKLLKWIYTGNVLMPDEIEHVTQLLLLADEYFLLDLKKRCEEALCSKLSPSNVVDIMVLASNLPLTSDSLMQECKEVFVRQYMSVAEHETELEGKLLAVPGLVTQLFHYFFRASKKSKRRRVTFRISEGTEVDHEASTINSGYSSTGSSYT